jgi:hypothetical protein
VCECVKVSSETERYFFLEFTRASQWIFHSIGKKRQASTKRFHTRWCNVEKHLDVNGGSTLHHSIVSFITKLVNTAKPTALVYIEKKIFFNSP